LDVRWTSRKALEQIGTPAVDLLMAALKDTTRVVRMGAAGALEEIGDPRAVEPLVVLKVQACGSRAVTVR
jgi:HEAT repeat protein